MDIQFEKIRWQYVSEEGRKWLDTLETASCQMKEMKYANQRSVYRHPAGVYIKKIQYKGFRSVYKTFFGGNASNEGRIALAMKKRGVPVPEVMAFGRLKSWRGLHQDILVTREVLNGQTVRDFIQNGFNGLNFKKKREIVEKFAEFMMRLHDCGVYHRDFHLNNILILNPKKNVEFSILDLNKVILYPGPVPLKKRTQQLGILLSICWGLNNRNNRFRFLHSYRYVNTKPERAMLVKGIMRQAGNHAHDMLSKKARQSVSTNSRFVKETSNGIEVYQKRESEDGPTFAELREDKNFPWKEGGQNEKNGQLEINGRICFLKIYSNISLTDRIWDTFGQCKGLKVWKKIWRFPFTKAPMPVPLMMVCRKSGKLQTTSYLISEYLSGAQPLNEYWERTNTVDKKRLCANLGILIGSLHQFGAFHGNLNGGNILVCPHEKTEKLYLRGVEGFKKCRRLRKRKAEKDIRILVNEIEKHCCDEHMKFLFLRCWRKWAGYS